ncbi:dihydrolipoyl dehydrogenase [Blastopirellula marina]|uniref:Dihydrolipoyl dehydrogenase n=1 Tax=Blastopirellula marina TaxID=124 RepID=A0A2S8EYP0_9BACT|nr:MULTISPECIES: dihydrolipoyl dehydrogenase [Pirellulaceae]PQO25023.1 dihydrolipoyl dehydrogenase [Blastopirellula marina]RCS40875.1 dihydrolipoyl dehydrogenase [Bremerella cremea]
MAHTQLAVIGGGPGGYAAAFLAADEGMEVTLIEKEPRLGGTCLLRGCIPSKALLHVARVIDEVHELNKDWGVTFSEPQIELDKLRARKEGVIKSLSTGLGQLAKKRNVTVIKAKASFIDSSTLELEGDDPSIPEGGKLTFDHAIVATGSVAAMPPAFQIDSPRVMDSTGALELQDIPETMLVIGGGYIGLEMGTVYAHLGTKVSVVELTDGLLPGADRNLVKPLAKKLEELFEGRIFTNTKVGSLGDRDGKVEVAFEGPNKFGTFKYDRVLVSIGRWPNTKGIGLENTQCVVDKRGFIGVDKQLRTADPKISAIGDVTGNPMLAHKATHEGRAAVEAILGHPVSFEPAAIPAVIFTDPEIAWAGLMEEEAKAMGKKVEVAMYPWAASGRAQALGRTDGLTKWIIDPETQRVLGCGIVGPGAGEMISEAVLALEMRAEVFDLTSTIHPHPTLSETVMNAGEVFFGTATEIYKPKKKS